VPEPGSGAGRDRGDAGCDRGDAGRDRGDAGRDRGDAGRDRGDAGLGAMPGSGLHGCPGGERFSLARFTQLKFLRQTAM